jgi:yeast amino acid transporter
MGLTVRSGGAIGAGLFIGSGGAFQTGGPASVLLGFIIVGELSGRVSQQR